MMISFLAKGKDEIWKNAKHQGRSVCSVGAERVSDDATYLVKFICIKSAAEIQTLNFFSPKYTRNPANLSVLWQPTHLLALSDTWYLFTLRIDLNLDGYLNS